MIVLYSQIIIDFKEMSLPLMELCRHYCLAWNRNLEVS
jgi:hypothetical protein